ncbi:MAG: hypothetical protein AABY22_32565 [Nanoarchaeota archaeon]
MKIIVEYSKSQDAFHRSTEKERLKNEKICSARGIKSDYEIIGEFSNYDEADVFIKENYDLIKKCRMFKDQNGKLYAI